MHFTNEKMFHRLQNKNRLKLTWIGKFFGAYVAFEWLVTGMYAFVACQHTCKINRLTQIKSIKWKLNRLEMELQHALDSENPLLHTSHLNGFSPLCACLWLFKRPKNKPWNLLFNTKFNTISPMTPIDWSTIMIWNRKISLKTYPVVRIPSSRHYICMVFHRNVRANDECNFLKMFTKKKKCQLHFNYWRMISIRNNRISWRSYLIGQILSGINGTCMASHPYVDACARLRCL